MSASIEDYRSTLQLPKTEFPMRASLPAREPEWLNRWERIGIYDELRKKQDRPDFVLHDGPPYANGHLHIGHALNKILKDMIVRSQQMMGKDSRYVPGWDCHGLPIEWKIEEQYRNKGISKDDVSVIELRRDCRQFADRWVAVQRNEFRRLGVIGNWDHPYLTMDFDAEAVIAAEFMIFVMNGTLYQGYKPVLWSTVEKTALAEAEVEYKDHKSDAIWVKFPLHASASDLGKDVSVLIWTTTPWTLPSNRAICFNPQVNYGLYEITDAPEDNWLTIGARILLADDLAEECFSTARVQKYTRIRSVAAAELERMTCAHPFRGMVPSSEPEQNRWDFNVSLIPADHVAGDAGTGFVHTAPSHGDDDFKIGQKHGLEMTDNVREDGSFREDLPLFGGHAVFSENGREGTANREVIMRLREVDALAARRRITHSYPHSWRSKAPLIYRCTRQWFAGIDVVIGDQRDEFGTTIRERALNSINSFVSWVPPSGRNRLYSMIESRPDWVLSRQRTWGVPLTCFTKKNCKPSDPDFLLRDEAVNRRIVDAFKDEGADAWYRPEAKIRFLDGLHDPDEYEQVFDILDVWFDSGSTHAFVLRDRSDGPKDGIADIYLEGSDQHRGWFHSSMLQSCGTNGRAPYREVLTHGFTLDEKGMKMAKSLGNTVAPEAIVRQSGADILRLWVAQSDYRKDLRIGNEILKGVTDSYRRIRNCFRFMLGNLFDFEPSNAVSASELPELERWVLHRIAETDEVVRKGYEAYDFQSVYQAIFHLTNTDLSAFYFDIRKDALYCDGPDNPRRRSAQTVLDILHRFMSAWLAPILVFTAEEIWLCRYPGERSSVHLRDFPEVPEEWTDDMLAKRWETVRHIRRVVTAALEIQRKAKIIGSSLEACPTIYNVDEGALEGLRHLDFADIFITSDYEFSKESPPDDAFSLPESPGIFVSVALAKGRKCERCWKYLCDVGTHAYADVCQRCNDVLITAMR